MNKVDQISKGEQIIQKVIKIVKRYSILSKDNHICQKLIKFVKKIINFVKR